MTAASGPGHGPQPGHQPRLEQQPQHQPQAQPEHQPEHLPPVHPSSSPRHRRARARVLVAVVAAVAVLGMAVLVPLLVAQQRAEPPDRTLDRVRVFTDARTDHTQDEVAYATTPPAGGPHDPTWLDCGVYDEPVRDENAVHDLEHGAVWITHDPELSADDVAALAEALPDNGILSPYEGLPAPVVVTVWERQLHLTGADDPRLPMFLAGFGDGHTSPEPFASCAGGVREDRGGAGTTQDV